MSRTDSSNEPLSASALIATSPASVNLMALPTRLSRTCVSRRSCPRQSALVPTAGRQVGLHLGLKCELLIERQRLDGVVDRLGDVLQRIIGKVERELTRFDLGEVEHSVDESEQMSAVALGPLEHRLHLFGRRAIDAVRDQLRTWAGGEHLVPQFQKSI